MHTKRTVGVSLFVLALLAVLGIAGSWYYHLRYAIPKLPAQYYAPHPNAAQTPLAKFDHIVIIIEENKTSSSIIGNGGAPYINQLARTYAQADNYYAVAHPSLPNYLALTSGTTAGITSDCNPPGGSCTANVTNIADEIEQSGRSWKMYAESMPSPCTLTNTGDYAVKHNPFLYYPDIRNNTARCNAHDVPFSRFAADLNSTTSLPNYAFISPNLCNDTHNCSIQTGDTWLAQHVPNILASPAFTTQNSLLVITWDEGEGQNNRVAAIFIGPHVKQGYVSKEYYSHYSLLKMIETSWDLKALTNNDRTAPVINDIFQ